MVSFTIGAAIISNLVEAIIKHKPDSTPSDFRALASYSYKNHDQSASLSRDSFQAVGPLLRGIEDFVSISADIILKARGTE